MGGIYSKFNGFNDFNGLNDSEYKCSNNFDFCCCANKGIELDDDYKQNDTDYHDEYIGVI